MNSNLNFFLDQLTQGFRKCGQLLRRIFLVKCVCLSPKGESAFYLKRQDSNSRNTHLTTNKIARVLGSAGVKANSLRVAVKS